MINSPKVICSLAHVQFRRDFLLTSELHHQILITGLALADRDSQVKLPRGRSSIKSLVAQYGILTMNKTCWSSLGSRNNFEMWL
jgi:hypothetical protein